MLKSVKSAWNYCGKLFAFFGAACLLAVAVFPEHMAVLTGGLFFPLGVSFLMYARVEKSKLARLKDEGIRYDGEIVGITTNGVLKVRGIGKRAARLEVSYCNRAGNMCRVKSGPLMLRTAYIRSPQPHCDGRPGAVVYVSSLDPDDYAIEVVEC